VIVVAPLSDRKPSLDVQTHHAQFRGIRLLVELYQRDRSSFIPNWLEDYLLRISYVPEPRLKGYKGLVYLRSTESI